MRVSQGRRLQSWARDDHRILQKMRQAVQGRNDKSGDGDHVSATEAKSESSTSPLSLIIRPAVIAIAAAAEGGLFEGTSITALLRRQESEGINYRQISRKRADDT